jgi:hypothetical protein
VFQLSFVTREVFASVVRFVVLDTTDPKMGHTFFVTVLFLSVVLALIADASASPDKRPFLPWIRPKREKLQTNLPIKTEEGLENSAPIGGGFSSIDVNDPAVKEIATFATSTIASKKSKSGPTKLIKIVKAESENVAGINYKLTLELNQPLAIDNSIICDVIVFDQTWTSTRILSESHCFPNKNPSVPQDDDLGLSGSAPINNSAILSKRHIPSVSRPIGGGFYPTDVENPEVKEMAIFASKVLESKRNSGPTKVTKIVTAESQAVAGTNYKLTLEISQPIAVVETERFLLCKVVVFNQPWTKTRILAEWNCTQNKNPSAVIDKSIRGSTAGTKSLLSFKDSLHVLAIPSAAKPIDGGLPLTNEEDISPPNKRHIPSGGFSKGNAEEEEDSFKKIPERMIGGGFTRVKAEDTSLNRTHLPGGLNPFDEEFSLVDVSETSPNKSEILLVPSHVEDGYSPVDVDNSYVKEIAAYATTAISSSRNSITLSLQRILSAEARVFGGTNYKLTLELDHFIAGAKAENLLCKVIVFDQKEDYRKMTDSLCLPIRNATVRTIDEVILESSLPPLSGFSPADVQADDVREMAYFATHVISNTRNPVALAEIVKAESQAHAAGRNYKLTLKLDSMVKETTAGIPTFQSGDLLCEIIVFFQTWSNTRILSESNCLPIKTIRVAGPRYVPRYTPILRGVNSSDGFASLDVEDVKVKEIAAFASNSISANSGPVTLLRILKAEAQTVAGKNYKLIIELIGTERDIQICDVVVFDQERSQTRILIDSKCNTDKTTSSKIPEVITEAPVVSTTVPPPEVELKNNTDVIPNKRQVPGSSVGLNSNGFSPVDVNNPEVKEMANFATSSISASDNPFILKLIKVVDAEAKFLFGKNFKLILRVKNMVKGADGDREMLCEVIIT